MRLSMAPLLLVSLLSAPAQTAGSGATSGAAPASAAATAVYRNDALHLSYTYPATFTDAAAVVGPALQASLSDDPTSADAARCVTLPFSRMQTGTTPGQISIVILVHADAACLKKKFNAKSLAEFTEGEAQGLTAAGAKTTFGQPIAYQVATRPAALLRGTFTLPAGQPMHAVVSCVLDQPDVVCWQFLASSAESLHSMIAFPVTFDNAPATPLVPASLLPSP